MERSTSTSAIITFMEEVVQKGVASSDEHDEGGARFRQHSTRPAVISAPDAEQVRFSLLALSFLNIILLGLPGIFSTDGTDDVICWSLQ